MSDAPDALFAEVGRDLFLSGAVTTHGGNLSMRDGDRIFISRRGAMLGRMRDGDVMETSMQPCERDADCSRELVVHRAIYVATDAKAIVHAHTLHTIYRSMVADSIEPIDSESRYVIGDSVPVFDPAEKISSSEAAALLSSALRHVSVAVLRSHGPFAIGESLEDAFYRVSALEASCQLLDLRDGVGLRLK